MGVNLALLPLVPIKCTTVYFQRHKCAHASAGVCVCFVDVCANLCVNVPDDVLKQTDD